MNVTVTTWVKLLMSNTVSLESLSTRLDKIEVGLSRVVTSVRILVELLTEEKTQKTKKANKKANKEVTKEEVKVTVRNELLRKETKDSELKRKKHPSPNEAHVLNGKIQSTSHGECVLMTETKCNKNKNGVLTENENNGCNKNKNGVLTENENNGCNKNKNGVLTEKAQKSLNEISQHQKNRKQALVNQLVEDKRLPIGFADNSLKDTNECSNPIPYCSTVSPLEDDFTDHITRVNLMNLIETNDTHDETDDNMNSFLNRHGERVLVLSPEVRYLNLSYLNIEEIDTIEGENLTEVDLSHSTGCKIPKMPDTVSVLNISGLILKEIKDGDLPPNLLKLYARGCDLRGVTLPRFLRVIDLGDNRLTKLDDLPITTIKLSVNNNIITSFRSNYRLDLINMDSNRMREINFSPRTRYIKANSNRLDRVFIPENTVKAELDNNDLDGGVQLPRLIVHFSCGNNKISNVSSYVPGRARDNDGDDYNYTDISSDEEVYGTIEKEDSVSEFKDSINVAEIVTR